MAVHRRAPNDRPDEYTTLGRVRVTIDDLEELADLLNTAHGPSEVWPKYEFVNGTFDRPVDLANLREDELSFIEVKFEDVEIILSSTHAGMYGSKDSCAMVKERWSSMRQTEDRPILRRDSKRLGIILISAILLVLNYVALISGWYRVAYPAWYGVTTGVGTVLVLAYSSFKVSRRPSSYAFIFPGSYSEFRRESGVRKRHSQAILASYAAILLAVISIVVSVILKFT
ncbi:hypothetical protein [Amycolatopsis sp. NPDC102389]|uniref:hypothetical protein n=1 Tax=Amycolatopsis sp. NPDC102389 TaxID=3363941 RepID=UPI0037F767DC